MTPAIFQILLSLSDGERHGYGVIREVQERSGGEFQLGPGTLYRSIRLMVRDGWLEPCPPPAGNPVDDERRIYYRITEQGRQEMRLETRRLSRLVRQAEAKRIFEGTS